MVDTLVAPVKIAAVCHSGYGHPVRIAEVAARGAAAINGESVELITTEEAPGQEASTPDDLHRPALDHGPVIDRSILVDARADLRDYPRSNQIPGRRKTMVALGTLIAATGLGLWAYDRFTAPPAVSAAVPPPGVVVALPVQASVADRTDLTGQFSAVNRVVLRAQVSGYLTEIHFKDGQIVHKGDLLFVIDPRPYEIQLEQAAAQFQTASATVALANKQIDRSARLNRAGFETDERLDERTQSQRTAAAAVKSAEAAIHAAQLNLEFTRIVAPFSGRMSRRHVSIGSLVTGGPGAPGSTELTTIVSLDPIYLDFDMSEADYAAYQHSAAAQPAGASAVHVSLDGERPWSRTGDLDFLDNEIDRSSGTLHARATLANADLAIAPGAFARVRVPLSAAVPQLLVPDAAVGTDQSGKLVMVVRDDGVVVPKPVETGPLEDHAMRVITDGLLPTDPVVVQGLMRVRPGMKVEPHLQTANATPKG
jgi:multidrug efflux system membrane fusion protein